MAQGADEAPETVSFWDNLFLDEWRIPFGEWMEQAVFWIVNKLSPVLDVVAWPFEFLIDNIVDKFLASDSVPWFWVVLLMTAIAAVVRNIRVASFVAVALFICGILGDNYWVETARTIGFIFVAVLMCVIIGIPVGIACGRVDGIWKAIRPVLDGMQVIHSFVYMLPFIFFWGIGEVSATMVTMVFALPPLIRLTNLGIRQVPEDVQEAARAYGASERRVLLDVQIPLARPAIMTGVNQTLLLSISMLGIAAIMGAGGLGNLLFQAISQQDVSKGASAGLAFLLVALVLDRTSQREGSDSAHLFRRIRRAWAHRRDPEALLDPSGQTAKGELEEVRYVSVGAAERLPLMLTFAGAVIAVQSVVLTWTSGAGKFSAYGRSSDVSLDGDLADRSFNGLDASGGSWFGISILLLGLLVVLSAVVSYFRPGRGPRLLAADGAVIASISITALAAAHLLGRPVSARLIENAPDPGTGIGVILALVGGVVASLGAVRWMWLARREPFRPFPNKVAWSRMVAVVLGLLLLFAAMFGIWSDDKRTETIVNPEIQAKIEELERRSLEPGADPAAISAEIISLTSQQTVTGVGTTDGVGARGHQLGLWAFVAGGLAFLASFPAIGLFGREDRRLWRWNAVVAGFGGGAAMISFAWIFTTLRSSDVSFVSGVGAFIALAGGLVIVASTLSVLREFKRERVYDDDDIFDVSEQEEEVDSSRAEPAATAESTN